MNLNLSFEFKLRLDTLVKTGLKGLLIPAEEVKHKEQELTTKFWPFDFTVKETSEFNLGFNFRGT